jgi:plasmid replication initiation protein
MKKSFIENSNLIQAQYYLNAVEQKLLYKIFEEIQKSSYTTNNISINHQIFFKDFKSVIGTNMSKKEFITLIENLQNRRISIINGNNFIKTQWYKIYEQLNSSNMQLELDLDVFEHIQFLYKDFMTIKLETLYSFKSFYSMRIYELIKQSYSVKKEIIYTLDYLKQILGIENNLGYDNFTNFDKNVISNAIQEINAKSEILVEYEKIKEGRIIKSILFKIIHLD